MKSFEQLSAAMKQRMGHSARGVVLEPNSDSLREIAKTTLRDIGRDAATRARHTSSGLRSLDQGETLPSFASRPSAFGADNRAFNLAERVSASGGESSTLPSEASLGLDDPSERAFVAPPDPADLELLREALATAAALEFATIPPYLVALWSVIDQKHAVARSIRAIVHEEMLHLVLVNNILVGVGGTPVLTGESVPVYPSRLPGGVRPELLIRLEGLTDEGLDTFLEIERPRVRVPVEGIESSADTPGDDQTIGEFYLALREFIHRMRPAFSTQKQIAGPLAPMVIASLSDVDSAFAMITDQGEGSTGTPVEGKSSDLAHYYRFLELKLERRLIWVDGRLLLGDRVRRPSTYPVAEPPRGGYADGVAPRISQLAADFNRCYSSMVQALEGAWGEGGHVAFLRAMEMMFSLRPLAQEMMRTPGPDGRGHAPEFRYVP